jgi:hypothetical protein
VKNPRARRWALSQRRDPLPRHIYAAGSAAGSAAACAGWLCKLAAQVGRAAHGPRQSDADDQHFRKADSAGRIFILPEAESLYFHEAELSYFPSSTSISFLAPFSRSYDEKGTVSRNRLRITTVSFSKANSHAWSWRRSRWVQRNSCTFPSLGRLGCCGGFYGSPRFFSADLAFVIYLTRISSSYSSPDPRETKSD